MCAKAGAYSSRNEPVFQRNAICVASFQIDFVCSQFYLFKSRYLNLRVGYDGSFLALIFIFCFPPPQQRPASGPNAVRRVGHLNAVHKDARLRHRNSDKEQKTVVLVSGVSFSFEYAALAPCRKSVPFGTVMSSLQRKLTRNRRGDGANSNIMN